MLDFAKQCIISPRMTGAIMPTSRKVIDRMIGMSNIRRADVVVELGPGNGVITERILESMKPGALFFAIELNPAFIRALKRRFPKIVVHHDSAVNLRKYLKMHHVKGCDCIVSILPWTLMERKVYESIIRAAYSCLNHGGEMLTLPYLSSFVRPEGKRLIRLLNSTFDSIEKTGLIWCQVPPAYIYCVKKS